MKILGYDYKVEIANPDDMGSHFGDCSFRKQRIRVSSILTTQNKISTVLHEIIEALNYHLELELEHNVIMSLEAGLYGVLADNGIDLSPLMVESNDE